MRANRHVFSFLPVGNCVRHCPHPKDSSEPLYTSQMADYHRADCLLWKNTVTRDVDAQLCSHSNPDFGSEDLDVLGTRGSGAMICDYEVRAILKHVLFSLRDCFFVCVLCGLH